MKRLNIILVPVALLAAGCRHAEEISLDGSGADAYGDEIPLAYGDFTGVDMLLVVDNSGSMGEEQEFLATSIFPLVNALTDPLPGWPFDPVDDLRVAVVSSDLGLQWGGNPYEYGDGWPGDTPMGCASIGDDGEFQTYSSGKTITLQHDVIPCDESASQCPTDWECGDFTGDVGTCQAPDGDGKNQLCPGMDAMWAETGDDDLAFEVACISALGTNGCGFEQQLQAAAIAIHKPDQQVFVRDGALLVVIEVSDEEDCSIESNELFAVPEIQQLAAGKVNVACVNHPQFLFSTTHLAQRLLAAKDGQPGSVVFAAIVGVPMDDVCQGTGDQITGCLDHPDMALDIQLESDAWFVEPACTRWVGDVLVTKARPGRRFVELATSFGDGGYVSSICNEDWRPAAEDIAQVIATRLEGSCFPEQLPWDADSQTAACQLFVTFTDFAVCPIPTDPDAAPILETMTDALGSPHVRLHCPLPRLATPLECAQVPPDLDGVGWYYCENPDAAPGECSWMPQVTSDALQLIIGRPAAIRCPIDG